MIKKIFCLFIVSFFIRSIFSMTSPLLRDSECEVEKIDSPVLSEFDFEELSIKRERIIKENFFKNFAQKIEDNYDYYTNTYYGLLELILDLFNFNKEIEGKKYIFQYDEIKRFLCSYDIRLDLDQELASCMFFVFVKLNCLGAVRLFIELGFNVNQYDSLLYTPLHIAVLNKNFKMVQLLVEHNADIFLKNFFNEDSLGLATRKGLIKISEYFLQNDVYFKYKCASKRKHVSCLENLPMSIK